MASLAHNAKDFAVNGIEPTTFDIINHVTQAYTAINIENSLPEKFGLEDFDLPGVPGTVPPSGSVRYQLKVWIPSTSWYPRDYFWIDITNNEYLSQEGLMALIYYQLKSIAAQYNQTEIPSIEDISIEQIT